MAENDWGPLSMTESGRPLLEPKEIEIKNVPQSVNIIYMDKNFVNGAKITLTTHRILIMKSPTYKSLSLSKITRVEKKFALFLGPFKLLLELNNNPKTIVQIVFLISNDREEFMEALNSQLAKKNWLEKEIVSSMSNSPASVKTPSSDNSNVSTPNSESLTSSMFSRSSGSYGLGIAGIKQKVMEQDKQVQESMNEAFTDINSLMEKAKDLVGLAENFSQHLSKLETKSDEQQEFDDLLATLGFSGISGCVVTKASYGAAFHRELAKQISDFLVHFFKNSDVGKKSYGMILIADAFCLYNRARGVGADCISPDDMWIACQLLEKLLLPITMKVYSSGIKVLCLRANNVFEERLMDFVMERIGAKTEKDKPEELPKTPEQKAEFWKEKYVTTVQIAQNFNMSFFLAKEILQQLEEKLLLSRDESAEGVRFYKNVFVKKQN